MLRKGFTLIELLIVITIIAILAGAAIPYVADYIEDGRAARAKQDMSEIRNALVRWELDRSDWPDAEPSIEPLVGPFLSQLLIDPWGFPYEIQGASSTVISFGRDGAIGGGDDLLLDFRPPMAITKVEYLDVDKNGTQSAGDKLVFYCTRPTAINGDLSNITVGDQTVDLISAANAVNGKTVEVTVNAVGWSGNEIQVTSAVTDTILDKADPPNGVKTILAGTLKLKSTGW